MGLLPLFVLIPVAVIAAFLVLCIYPAVRALTQKKRYPVLAGILFVIALLAFAPVIFIAAVDTPEHVLYYGGRFAKDWMNLFLLPSFLCAAVAMTMSVFCLSDKGLGIRIFAILIAVLLVCGAVGIPSLRDILKEDRVAVLTNGEDELVVVHTFIFIKESEAWYKREDKYFLTPMDEELTYSFRDGSLSVTYNGKTYTGPDTIWHTSK